MKNLTFILCLVLLAGCGEAEKSEEVVPAEAVPVEETTE